MGLHVSHGCWVGAYSAFHNWRSKLAEIVGLNLEYTDGFNDKGISWDLLKPDPLYVLLNHSDWEGIIAAADCAPLAQRLEELLPLLPSETDPGHIGNWRAKTQRFIDGLRAASKAGEDIEFG